MTNHVLQKLLPPSVSDAVANQGLAWVTGPVVDAASAGSLATPGVMLRAYGLDQPGGPFGLDVDAVPYVDVMRFASHGLMQLRVPEDDGVERPWPTYPSGFLAGSEPVPVWTLDATRVPVGAEFWRIATDGRQERLSVYGGAARGWRGAKAYQPPRLLVGPRALWRGQDVAADPIGDTVAQQVELVVEGADPGNGFELTRPQIWSRRVPLTDCDRVFELRMTCTWRDVACRIVQAAGEQVLLLLVDDRPDAVSRTGARQTEPDVFQVVAPVAELEDRLGTTRELARRAE